MTRTSASRVLAASQSNSRASNSRQPSRHQCNALQPNALQPALYDSNMRLVTIDEEASAAINAPRDTGPEYVSKEMKDFLENKYFSFKQKSQRSERLTASGASACGIGNYSSLSTHSVTTTLAISQKPVRWELSASLKKKNAGNVDAPMTKKEDENVHHWSRTRGGGYSNLRYAALGNTHSALSLYRLSEAKSDDKDDDEDGSLVIPIRETSTLSSLPLFKNGNGVLFSYDEETIDDLATTLQLTKTQNWYKTCNSLTNTLRKFGCNIYQSKDLDGNRFVAVLYPDHIVYSDSGVASLKMGDNVTMGTSAWLCCGSGSGSDSCCFKVVEMDGPCSARIAFCEDCQPSVSILRLVWFHFA